MLTEVRHLILKVTSVDNLRDVRSARRDLRHCFEHVDELTWGQDSDTSKKTE